MAITLPLEATPASTALRELVDPTDLALGKTKAGITLTADQRRLVVLHCAAEAYNKSLTPSDGCIGLLLDRAVGANVCELSDEWAAVVAAFELWSRVDANVDDVRFTYSEPVPSRDWMYERVQSDLDDALDVLVGA